MMEASAQKTASIEAWVDAKIDGLMQDARRRMIEDGVSERMADEHLAWWSREAEPEVRASMVALVKEALSGDFSNWRRQP